MFRYKPQSLVSIVLLTSLLTACANLPETGQQDRWFGADKAKHFAVSTALGAAFVDSSSDRDCNRVALSISAVMLIGTGKEFYDQEVKRTYFSYKDMLWNLLGSSIGAMSVSDC